MKNLVLTCGLLCANAVFCTAHNSPRLPFKMRTEKSLNGIFFNVSTQNLPFSRLVVEQDNERLASNILIISNEFAVPQTLQQNDLDLPILPINMTENLLVLEVFSEL